MSDINKRFKEVRNILKISQKDFADSVGISRSHLSGIENGKDNPSLTLIKLACVSFGINEEWLIEEKGAMFSKDNGFDTRTDEGLQMKYQNMKDFLEKLIEEQTGDNLKNIVQAYSNFVSLVTMPGLDEDNHKEYLEAIYNINDVLEKLIYSTYSLKIVSNSNYKALLQHREKVNAGLSSIMKDIKRTLSCYLKQYDKDLTL